MAYQADTATEIDSYKGDPDLAIGSGGTPVSGVIVGRGEHPFALVDAVATQLDEFAKKKEAKKIAFQKSFSDELKNTSDVSGILEKDTPEIMALQKDLYRYINQKPHVLTPEGATKYQSDYSEFMAKEQALTRAIQKSKDDVAFDKAWQKELFAHPNEVNQKIYESWKAKSLKDRDQVSPTLDPTETLRKNSNDFFVDNSEKRISIAPIIELNDKKEVIFTDPYHEKEITTNYYDDKLVKQFVDNNKQIAQQYYVAFDQLEKAKKKELIDKAKLTEEGKVLETDAELLQLAKETFVEDKIRQFIPVNNKAVTSKVQLSFEGQKQLAGIRGDASVQASNEKLDYKNEHQKLSTKELQDQEDKDNALIIADNIRADVNKLTIPNQSQDKINKATDAANSNNLSGQLFDISIPDKNGTTFINSSPRTKKVLSTLLNNPKHIFMLIDPQGNRIFYGGSDSDEVKGEKTVTPKELEDAMNMDKDTYGAYETDLLGKKEQSQPSTSTKQKSKGTYKFVDGKLQLQ